MQADDPRSINFRNAVLARDRDALRSLFNEHPEMSSVVDEPWFDFDMPAIVHAAAARDRPLVDTLLELGADIDARSAWANGPYSALHSLVDGADEASLALAEHLAERGASIDLHAAAGMGRVDVIERILDAEPERVSEPGPDGATPLHLARNVTIARLLLKRGAEIDKRCVDHRSTPAMWATQGREEVMGYLVARGARPDLFMAVLLNDRELAAEILEAEPDAIDVRVYPGRSHEHLGFGDKYVWTLGGADTPLELARHHGYREVYEFLLERSGPGRRLVQASRRSDTDAIDELTAREPGLLGRLDERDVCEALYGSVEGARRLLEHGADPSARDDRAGATALHHAAWQGLAELASVLLDGGADASIRDHNYSSTPLGWANESGQTELMDLILLRHQPDVVDAAWLGDADRVRVLLARDASLVDGLDGGRVSPLRSAAWCGHLDVVKVLLEYGADAAMPNPENGKTALDFARERGHEEIVALLRPDGDGMRFERFEPRPGSDRS